MAKLDAQTDRILSDGDWYCWGWDEEGKVLEKYHLVFLEMMARLK